MSTLAVSITKSFTRSNARAKLQAALDKLGKDISDNDDGVGEFLDQGDLVVMITPPIDMSLVWRPIAELSSENRCGDDAGFLLICAPELVDLDCNPDGVGMGFWQDDGLLWNMSQEACDARDKSRDYGCWLVGKWGMSDDEWRLVPCTPTYYARIAGPQK